MQELSSPQKAQRLRIYISESDRWRGNALSSELLETLKSQGLAGATLLRGLAGFGAHSRIHNTAIEALSFDLPLIIEVVDTPEKINAALETVYPMVREGLITLEDVQIIKYTQRFLNPLPADRLVSEVMTGKVVTLSADKSVQYAWKQMLAHVVKVMPVIDENRRVVGILTDEDLLERAGVRQRLSLALKLDDEEINRELNSLGDSQLLVKDVMSHPVITVKESDSLGFAVSLMVKHRLKRLPVIDEQARLAGMLSRLDVLRQVDGLPQAASGVHLPTGAARTVGEVMITGLPLVHEDDRLPDLVACLSRHNSNRLVVIDKAGKALGLISDSDIIARIQPEKRSNILDALRNLVKPSAGNETAHDLMSSGVLTAFADTTIVDAVQKMLAESRKWLVIVDKDNHPLGLVDRQILLESIAAFLRKTAQYPLNKNNF